MLQQSTRDYRLNYHSGATYNLHIIEMSAGYIASPDQAACQPVLLCPFLYLSVYSMSTGIALFLRRCGSMEWSEGMICYNFNLHSFEVASVTILSTKHIELIFLSFSY